MIDLEGRIAPKLDLIHDYSCRGCTIDYIANDGKAHSFRRRVAIINSSETTVENVRVYLESLEPIQGNLDLPAELRPWDQGDEYQQTAMQPLAVPMNVNPTGTDHYHVSFVVAGWGTQDIQVHFGKSIFPKGIPFGDYRGVLRVDGKDTPTVKKVFTLSRDGEFTLR